MYLKRSLQLFCGKWIKRGQGHKEATAAVQMGDFDDLDQSTDVENGERDMSREGDQTGWMQLWMEHGGEGEDIVKDNFQVSGLKNAHR